MKKELEKAGDVYAEELQRLYRFLEDGERIRVWYSDALIPDVGFIMSAGFWTNMKMKCRQ